MNINDVLKFLAYAMLTVALGILCGTILYHGLYWLIYEVYHTTLFDIFIK